MDLESGGRDRSRRLTVDSATDGCGPMDTRWTASHLQFDASRFERIGSRKSLLASLRWYGAAERLTDSPNNHDAERRHSRRNETRRPGRLTANGSDLLLLRCRANGAHSLSSDTIHGTQRRHLSRWALAGVRVERLRTSSRSTCGRFQTSMTTPLAGVDRRRYRSSLGPERARDVFHDAARRVADGRRDSRVAWKCGVQKRHADQTLRHARLLCSNRRRESQPTPAGRMTCLPTAAAS